MKQNNINSQVFYNSLSTIILSGINFFTIPIFTRILGATQYGLYTIFYTWVSLLIPIMSLESDAGLGVARYDFNNEYGEYKKNSLILGTTFSVVITILIIIFRSAISYKLGFPKEIVLIMPLMAFSIYVVNFIKGVYTYEKKAGKNLLISCLLAFVSAFLSYYFVINNIFEEPYIGRTYGVFLPYVIIGAVVWTTIVIKNDGKINKTHIKYSLVYGFPIIFHALSHDALGQANRLLLEYLGFAGPIVGIYSFYQSFTSVLNMILTALNSSWSPFYYDYLDSSNYEEMNVKIKNYIELFTVITIGFILLSREVCYMFSNEEYWSGMNIIPVLAISIYFVFMYQFPVNFEYFNKKTKVISLGTIISGLLCLMLSFLLIPKFGMYGAAIATLVSYLFLFVAHFVISKRIKEMKFHMKFSDFLLPLLCLLFASISYYLLKNYWYIRWIIGAILGIYELIKIIKRKSIF